LEIEFHNKKIETLYTTGKSSKLKLDQQIVQSFFETVAILESAKDIHDLWNSPGLHFEKLQRYTHRYSARLSRKWRLEMSIDWQNEQMTVGIIGLEEISNHYGG
jgi:proteic killer suppression protein